MVNRISIIGLGKLGASMAAAFATRGYSIIGVDVNHRTVDAITAGQAPVQETDLFETLQAYKEQIQATLSHEEAILNSDVSFVIVPTPSDERGAFSLQYAEWAFKEIGQALAKKKNYHNIVLTSTVLPGSTRNVLLPILERESRKRAGIDFGLCYSPEFIALGSIIKDFLNPDFTLIGEFDERCGSQLEEIYSMALINGAPSARMSLENAELTKITLNSFVTTKITFANMIGQICEKLPGGDVDVVTKALGMDSRIGEKYLKGALGYGGPCFPRDNVALDFIARELGIEAPLPSVVDRINKGHVTEAVERVMQYAKPGQTVAVLGLAYKPSSHVTEQSQGLAIAEQLSKRGLRVVAFDPMWEAMDLASISTNILVMESLKECLVQSRAVIITTPDPAFLELKDADFANTWSQVLVFDFWRILKHSDFSGRVRYIGVGMDSDRSQNAARIKDLWATDKDKRSQSEKNG